MPNPDKEANTDIDDGIFDIEVGDGGNQDDDTSEDQDIFAEDNSEDQPKDDPSGDEPDSEEDEEQEDDAPDPDKYVSMEQYKQLQSSTTKGAQKLLSKNKAQDMALDKVPEIADDPEKLLDLYNERPQVAEIILKKFYDGITIEEFASQETDIDDWTPTKSTKKGGDEDEEEQPLSQEEMREQIKNDLKKERLEEENKEYLGKLVVASKINEEEATTVLDEFSSLTEGKDLDKTTVLKYYKMAYYSVMGKPVTSNSEKVAKSTATKKGAGGKSKKSEKQYSKKVQDSIDVLGDMEGSR